MEINSCFISNITSKKCEREKERIIRFIIINFTYQFSV